MANINWSDPKAQETMWKFKSVNPNYSDDQAKIALSELVDQWKQPIDRFITPQQKPSVEYKVVQVWPLAGQEQPASFDVPWANTWSTIWAWNVATPIATTNPWSLGVWNAVWQIWSRIPSIVSKWVSTETKEAIKNFAKNLPETVKKVPKYIWKKITEIAPKVWPFLKDLATTDDVLKTLWWAGKVISPTIAWKVWPMAELLWIWKATLLWNPYITSLIWTAISKWEDSQWDIKERWWQPRSKDSWKDAWSFVASILDNVAFKIPSTISPDIKNFIYSTPEEKAKIQENNNYFKDRNKDKAYQEDLKNEKTFNEAFTWSPDLKLDSYWNPKWDEKANKARRDQIVASRKAAKEAWYPEDSINAQELFKTYIYDPKQWKVVQRTK